MDCSPLGSSVRRVFQARILEWVAISFCRGSSLPRDRMHVSCIDRWILYPLCHQGNPGVGFFISRFGRLQLKESDQDTVHAPIYACDLGKEFNFVNLAYRDRLIFFWEGWERFAITGEDTWQLSHESWNGFCRVVSKFTLWVINVGQASDGIAEKSGRRGGAEPDTGWQEASVSPWREGHRKEFMLLEPRAQSASVGSEVTVGWVVWATPQRELRRRNSLGSLFFHISSLPLLPLPWLISDPPRTEVPGCAACRASPTAVQSSPGEGEGYHLGYQAQAWNSGREENLRYCITKRTTKFFL